MLNQPGCRKVEHQAGSFAADPSTGIEHTTKTKRPVWIAKFTVAIVPANQSSMFTLGRFSLRIISQYRNIFYRELPSHKRLSIGGYPGHIRQKRS